jgi:cytoskeletal protein CcmA (bactofilin family)
MRTMFGVLAAGVLVFAPLSADAATLVAREQLSLSPLERVSGNFYAAGGSVSIGAPVTGDVMVAGGSVAVTGLISGDLAVTGGTVQVLGPVSGDVRVMAGQTTIAGRVGGDLVLAGGTVHLLPGAVIGGDLYAAAGTTTIDGAVNGDARTVGGLLAINGTVNGDVQARMQERLVLGSAARIGGALRYHAPVEATIASGARVTGGVAFDRSLRLRSRDLSAGAALGTVASLLTGFAMLASLGMAALVVWRYRRPALEVIAEASDGFWPSLGRGLVYGLLTPIAALLLLVSIIGSIPGVLALMLFGAVCILARVLAGILLGALLEKIIRRQQTLRIGWVGALGGTVAFRLLAFIPVVGWLITLFLGLAVFGVLAQRAQKALA